MPFLNRASLFSGGGATTSVVDVEELIAAAREEMRQAGRAQKMPSCVNCWLVMLVYRL